MAAGGVVTGPEIVEALEPWSGHHARALAELRDAIEAEREEEEPAVHAGYVRLSIPGQPDEIAVQVTDESPAGWAIVRDEDDVYPGGDRLPSGTTWEPIPESEVSAEDRERLGWALEAA